MEKSAVLHCIGTGGGPRLQLVPPKSGLDDIKSTEEIKDHNPHSAFRFLQMDQSLVQDVDDGIIIYLMPTCLNPGW